MSKNYNLKNRANDLTVIIELKLPLYVIMQKKKKKKKTQKIFS